MFIQRLQLSALVALLWATSISAPQAAVAIEQSEKNIKSSLELVENLLSKSSIVKTVRSSNLPEATDSLNQAFSFHKKALENLSAGNLSAAAKDRDEVMRLLMLAGRLANQESGYSNKKPLADYEKKLKSVNALLAAHKRITDDNSDTVKESKLQESVMPLIKQSEKRAKEQQFKDALASLNRAYIVIAESIKSQRDGQSLVRSLDFATYEEAFDYEISKYEHYVMLVNMLIEERKTIKRDARSKPFFDESKSYYDQGMELASKGKHEQAIAFIEKASKSLVNLIRDSGVYIPGV